MTAREKSLVGPQGSGSPLPRDRSIDVLKGLGIIVVAMGHIDATGIGGSFVSYLYTFNVALFFIIAGYMWRDKPGVSLWSVVKLKFRQIYVPYLVLFGVSLLFGHIVMRYLFRQYVIPFEFIPTVRALAFSSEWLNSVPTFNFALWFLPIFFIATLAFQLLQKVRNVPAYLLIVLALLALSIPFQQLLPGRPILNINVLPVAVAFMACGFLLRKYVDVRRIQFPLLVLMFVFTLLASYVYPGNVSGIGTYWYFPSALASFVLYLRLAQQFESSWLLGYIGRNSLIIFGIHGLAAASYPFSRIPTLFAKWDGLMMYLINLSYVVLGSVVAVMLYRWARTWPVFSRSPG